MADRTVRVILEGNPDDLIKAFAEGVAAAKGFERGVDGTSTKTKSNFDGMGKASTDFERIVTKNLKDGETAFASINRRSTELRSEITRLRGEFAKTGSSDSFAGLKQAEKDLRGLKSIARTAGIDLAKDLAPAGEQAGRSFGDSLLSGAQKALAANPLGGAIGAGLIVASTPFIVAGLSAAIAGGVGAGFIAAGAIIQHNNPALQSAFAQLKADAVQTGKLATSALVTPFQEAILSADHFVTREGPNLAKIFTDLAPAVRPLQADLQNIGATLLPSLDKAAQGFTKAISSPAVTSSVQALANQLAGLFNTIGNHPQEIADGFRTIFTVVNAGVAVVKGITEAYAAADNKLTQWHNDIQNWIDKQGGAADANHHFATSSAEVVDAEIAAAGGIDNYNKALAALNQQVAVSKGDLSSLATELGQTKITADTLAASLESRVFTTMMNSDMATLGWNEALTNLRATLKQNKDVIDENAKSTIKHRQAAEADKGAILAAVSANQQVYQTMIASGVSANDAAAAYDSNERALRKQLLAAGLTKKQVDGLIGSYDKVPDSVNTVLAVKGLTDAINNLDSTLLLLNHINGYHANASVTTTYYTKGTPHTGPLSRSHSRWGGIYEHAAEGVLNAAKIESAAIEPARYAYAERATGGEAFIPRYGDAERSVGILRRAADWYGQMLIPAMRGMQVAGGDGAAAPSYVTNLTVQPQQANFTTRDLDNLMQVQEIRQRIGRPR